MAKLLSPNYRDLIGRKIVAIVQDCMQDQRFAQTVLSERPKCVGVNVGDLTLAMSEKVETLPGRWRSLVDIWRSGQGKHLKVFSAEVEPFALISLKNGEWVDMLERIAAGRLN